MLFIFGFGYKTTKNLGTLEPKKCDHCNNTVANHKIKVTSWFTLFFIPIIPYSTKHYVICPICNHGIEVSAEVFENIEVSEENYNGKNDVQINFLKQMAERNNN